MITTNGLSEMTQILSDNIASGEITLDGVVTPVALHEKKIVNGVIRIELYFDDTVEGTITASRLISVSGTVLMERPESVIKPVNKGLLILFSLAPQEVIA